MKIEKKTFLKRYFAFNNENRKGKDKIENKLDYLIKNGAKILISVQNGKIWRIFAFRFDFGNVGGAKAEDDEKNGWKFHAWK